MRTHFEGFSGSENITYSLHALQRMRERGVSQSDVRTILDKGTCEPAARGCLRYVLEPKWFVLLDRTGTLSRLVDWSVIIDRNGEIVTVYPDDGDLERFRWCDIIA